MKRVIYIILILLPILSFWAFAGGQKEDPLAKARLLFEQKKYNETIIYLSELVKKDPEYRDEVEKLIEKIRLIRAEYNKKYEKLIDVLFEKHDVEGALKLIEELKELDPNPNKATITSITRAKRGAEIVYNFNRFEKIMNTALYQLKNSKYYDAVNTYLKGFDIQKDEFDKASYGDIIKNSVNASLESVFRGIKDFNSVGRETDSLFGIFAVLVAGTNTKDFFDTSRKLINNLRKIIRIKRELKRAADVFKESNDIIRSQSKNKLNDYFLYYAYLLINGRKNFAEREGLFNAIDLYFRDTFSIFEGKTIESAFLHLTKAKDLFKASDSEKALTEFNIAYTFFTVLADAKSLWGSDIEVAKNYSFSAKDLNFVKQRISDFLYITEILHSIDAYRKMIAVTKRVPDSTNLNTQSVDQLKSTLSSLFGLLKELEGLKSEWERYRNYYENIRNVGINTLRNITIVNELMRNMDKIVALVNRRNIEIVNALNFIEYKSFVKTLESHRAEFEKGKKLKDGYDVVVDTVKDEKGNIIEVTKHERYPSKAIEVLSPLIKKVMGLNNDVSSLIKRLGNDPILATDKKEQKKWITKTEKLLNQVVVLENSINRVISEANELILLARKYENEGNLRLNEARLALKLEKFQRAKEAVGSAAKAFENSLKYEANEEIRNILDKILPALSAEIVKKENLYVVREVRRLINKGREYYGLGDFGKAEETFLKAKARWEDTNVTENKEITNWLNIVRAALSVKSGRVISEKDPLYTEMTQLLNLAREDYLEGARLLKEGKKLEALVRFKSALDKIQRVKLAFPYNREARVLSLRIQQLSDPENFASSLTKFYNEAIRNITVNPKEAYADLKDIEEIKPDYPGLKRAIYRLEVLLKIIIPPPDPKKIAESNRLYEQAYKIVAANRVDLFPAALDQLNRAIELNPNNGKAIALKDRIQIAAGGTIQTVLSSAALEQFRLAESKYLAGEYFEALAIVERLLRDKRNKNYPPLLELKKRLETKI